MTAGEALQENAILVSRQSDNKYELTAKVYTYCNLFTNAN